MSAQIYHVRSPAEVERIRQDVLRRLKLFGPVEVVVSKVGEPGEYQAWMRRYHKLVALVSEQHVEGGKTYSPRVWDVAFKEMFLLPDEVELPDGRTVPRLPSKRAMTREQRDEFLSKVREWAAERGVHLKHPEEEGA